jgi:rhamnosyltransferase
VIAAVVVFYRPDLNVAKRVLSSLAAQVDTIFAVDNTPGSSEDLSVLVAEFAGASYLPLEDNKGIATAQNAGIRQSAATGHSHVLLLDQDSAVPPGMVGALLKAETKLLRAGARVAAVGPLYVDKKTNTLSYAIRYRWFRVNKVLIDPSAIYPVESDWLISSGSLIRTSVLEEVGPMLDELFIDWVDAEWGMRARKLGLRSFVVPNASMDHSVGDSSGRVLGHTINFHNLTRNYYIVRNATYLLRPREMGWRWVTVMLLKIPRHIAVHSWYSERKLRSLAVLVGAVFAGALGRIGRTTEK